MKVIIVGGVAGGATAAARIRRLDEHAEITVFELSLIHIYFNYIKSQFSLQRQCNFCNLCNEFVI